MKSKKNKIRFELKRRGHQCIDTLRDELKYETTQKVYKWLSRKTGIVGPHFSKTHDIPTLELMVKTLETMVSERRVSLARKAEKRRLKFSKNYPWYRKLWRFYIRHYWLNLLFKLKEARTAHSNADGGLSAPNPK